MADLKDDALRLQMINSQLRTSDVNEIGILEAFAAVDRAAYVAPAQRGASSLRPAGPAEATSPSQ